MFSDAAIPQRENNAFLHTGCNRQGDSHVGRLCRPPRNDTFFASVVHYKAGRQNNRKYSVPFWNTLLNMTEKSNKIILDHCLCSVRKEQTATIHLSEILPITKGGKVMRKLKKPLSILISLILVLSLFTIIPPHAFAADSVWYIYRWWNSSTNQVQSETKYATAEH